MLIGAHSVIYSTNADADRTFLRDVLKLAHVDGGGGYLIFAYRPQRLPYMHLTRTMCTSSI